MTGWLPVIGLVLLVGFAMWRFAGLPRAAGEAVAAALLLGLAGYAVQGRPDLPGAPRTPRADAARVAETEIALRAKFGDRMGGAQQYLIAADGAMRAGVPAAAIGFIRRGLKDYPRDADLWLGLGNAFVVYNEGQVSPAAMFAFRRAAEIAPLHPGPPFFMGLALAQSGRFNEARDLWQQLLARSPADAPWRDELEARIAELPA